jgi:hypothetical protein
MGVNMDNEYKYNEYEEIAEIVKLKLETYESIIQNRTLFVRYLQEKGLISDYQKWINGNNFSWGDIIKEFEDDKE